MNITFIENNLWLFAILAIWELFWKGLALWRAAEHRQRYWFVALMLINTVGILPILYLTFFNDNKLKEIRWSA